MNCKIAFLRSVICILCLTACASPPIAVPVTLVPTVVLAAPSSWPTTTPSPTPTQTSTAILQTDIPVLLPQVCSPLQGIPIAQLPAQISNPYHPPRPGSDDPHQGVDLADFAPGSRMAVKGHAVQAVMAGKVVMVTQDRFPYGYTLLIETPLDQYALEGWATVQIPTPAPTFSTVQALTCPARADPLTHDPARRSIYLLYGHLQAQPSVLPGERVSCGQTIGSVGDSGNALNPHLHFEARVGPSGMAMTSMAHYDASASNEEMSNYCLWRISGLFQLVDPLKVLTLPQ